MNSDKIEISLGVSIILSDVINLLLYTKKTAPDGKEYYADRELPFRLRYRLNKNRLLFEKDEREFQNYRLLALAKYGEPTEDGKNVIINDPHKQELFKEELGQILETPVTHSIFRLEPEDIDLVTDTDMNISEDAMALFIGYLTNDPELQKDLDTKLSVKLTYPKTEETVKADQAPEAPVEEAPTVNGEPPVVEEEEAPVEVKKTTTKKKSTTSTTKKSTTTKKTTTKKAEGETVTAKKTEEAPKKTTTRKPKTKKVEE